GTAHSGASLLGLLGGNAQDVIVFTPGANYNGVRVEINPTVDVGTTVDFFGAYFLAPASGPVACDSPAEVIWGSTGSIAGGLNTVDNPQAAIDGNAGGTPARLNPTVSALNETFITALYNTLSTDGDSVRIVLQAGSQSLLDLGVLSTNLAIRTYNDNTLVSEVTGNSGLLRLELLPTPGNVYEVVFPVDAPFNRISVAAGGGLANLLNGLNIYEIERISAGPEVTGVVDDVFASCAGSSVNLTIENPVAGLTYQWYDESGTAVGTGTSFDAGVLTAGDHIYYVSSTRSGCTTESGRTMVVVQVTEAAVPGDITVSDAVECEGLPVELTPTSLLSNPVYTRYKDVNKAQPITNGTEGLVSDSIDQNGVHTIPGLPGGSDITDYVAVTSDEKCENAAGDLTSANVKITTAALADDITIEDEVICEGASAVLRPSSGLISPEYRWYRN